MKNQRIVLAIGSLCVLFGGFILKKHFIAEKDVYLTQIHFRNTESEREDKEEVEQDGMEKVMEQEFYMTRDPRLNRIPFERLELARRQAETMKLGAGMRDAFVAGLGWQERGPNNIGGRVRAILIDRSDATSNTVIAASVSGGVWRSTNFKSATPVWTPINDFLPNLAICALAQDPRPGFDNIMYAGTGEGYFNTDFERGLGVFKSTDYGLTWSLLSSTIVSGDFDFIQRLLVDNSGNVYAASTSRYCNRGGVLKSADGGSSWKRVVGYDGLGCAPSSFDMEGVDLEIGSNNDLYATVGLRHPGKIYKSSFAANGAATGDTGTWVNITPSGSYHRIEIAVAPSNPNRIYALFVGASSNDVTEIRRSDDAGTTWTAAGTLPVPRVYSQGAKPIFTNGQAWYDLNLAVHPLNDDTLVIGGLDLLRSYDAGANWRQISNWTGRDTVTIDTIFTENQYVHADQHIMVYDPANPSNAIFGNDGGVFYSPDINSTGFPTFSSKNSGFNVTQYYAADLHPFLADYILGGAQDNGSHRFWSPGINAVEQVAGGDGGFCHIDQKDGHIQIVSYVYNTYSFSLDGGASFSGFISITPNYTRFINPTDYDDSTTIFYVGDAPGSYGAILYLDSLLVNKAQYFAPTISAFGSRTVSAIKVDPNTPNRVWFGVSDENASTPPPPQVVRVDNANTTPSAVAFNLPGLIGREYISSIDVQEGDANHILVTVSNYGVASVFETTDGGTTWVPLDNNSPGSPNLPDMPIRWGMFIPPGYNPGQRVAAGTGGILLGTELGVWSTSASNGTSTVWSANNAGLANVRVDMLKMRKSDKMVVAATHGRGMFTTTLVAGALPVTFRSFSGTGEDRYNRLVWQVENEYDNRGFELERKYPGSNSFTSIGFISGKNTSGRNNYLFNDFTVDLGKDYAEYRLKQVDVNGRAHYSQTVVVNRTPSTRLIEYVSSTGNDLFIRVNNENNQSLTLQFFDVKGSLLQKKVIANRSQHINTAWLTPGVYVVNIVNSKGERFTKKIWK